MVTKKKEECLYACWFQNQTAKLSSLMNLDLMGKRYFRIIELWVYAIYNLLFFWFRLFNYYFSFHSKDIAGPGKYQCHSMEKLFGLFHNSIEMEMVSSAGFND